MTQTLSQAALHSLNTKNILLSQKKKKKKDDRQDSKEYYFITHAPKWEGLVRLKQTKAATSHLTQLN